MVTAFKKKPVADPNRIAEAARASLAGPVDNNPLSVIASAVIEAGAINPAGVVGAAGVPTPNWEVGKVYAVPLNFIKENPYNARAIYSDASLKTLTDSIAKIGQETSAIGFVEGGLIVLIDGHRRLSAVKAAGLDTLRIEIKPSPTSDQALYLASRVANKERSGQTPLDDAIVWCKLFEKKIFRTQAELAETIGTNESTMSRTLALSELSPAMISIISGLPDLLNLKMLSALRQYEQELGTEKAVVMALEAAEQGFGHREVAARRKAMTAPPRTRHTPVMRKIKLEHGEGTIKGFATDGRVEVSLKGLTEAQTEELCEKIAQLLEKPSTVT